MDIEFDNTYAALPDRFYTRLPPDPVPTPKTIRVNRPLAEQLGFDPDWLASEDGAEFATGNRILEGAEPIATVYAGHQFGNWAGRLGDGRAILLGEVLDEDGERFDIQLKGSGRTPYSRRGDGRSPLGPVLREYMISEAMHALGIPTTRSLVAASTGEQVRRETALPGGVLVRVARSHIRVGTFEHFASLGDTEAIRTLVDHVVRRHYPQLDPGTPLQLLGAVAKRQAELIAQWQLVGFIHGVMNTDNMLLSGETIDYGPCAFMNEYDPRTVYSSIDRTGRYAYGNQPPIAQWNLSRLAGALFGEKMTEVSEAQEVIDGFPDLFRDAYGQGMANKLGLGAFRDDDWPLVEDLLERMYETRSDYTLTFVRLSRTAEERDASDGLLELPDEFGGWVERWRTRVESEGRTPESARREMRRANPVVIPRNHLVQEAIDDAVTRGDFQAFHRLVDALASPYDVPMSMEMVRPPRPEEEVQATFCGT